MVVPEVRGNSPRPAARSSVQVIGTALERSLDAFLEHQSHYCIFPISIAFRKSNSRDHVISTRGLILALPSQAFEVGRRRSTASFAIPQEA